MQTYVSRYYITYMLTVSFLAIFFVILIPFTYRPTSEYILVRMPLVGSIFITICILGILAIFSPRKCSNIIHLRIRAETNLQTEEENPYQATLGILKFKITHGHHPQCSKFLDHEFKSGKRSFCAGCTGLLIGTIASLIGSIGYFFYGWSLQGQSFLVALGIIGVILGLLQFQLFRPQKNYHRIIFNTYFVFGMFLILIGNDSIAQSFQIDLFLILIFLFWMATRIFLSKYNHDNICIACGFMCRK